LLLGGGFHGVAQGKNSCFCCAGLKTLLPARQQAVYKSGKAARASADVL